MTSAPKDEDPTPGIDRWPWNDLPARVAPEPARVQATTGAILGADDADARFDVVDENRPERRSAFASATANAFAEAAYAHEVPGFDTEFWSDLAMTPAKDGEVPRGSRRRGCFGRRRVLLVCVVVLGAVAGAAWLAARSPNRSGPGPGGMAIASRSESDHTATVRLGGRVLTFRLDTCSSSQQRVSAKGVRGDDTLVAVVAGNQMGSVLLEVDGTQWAAGHAGRTALTTKYAHSGASGAGQFAKLDESGAVTAIHRPGGFDVRCSS
jgi:hypothetical protein